MCTWTLKNAWGVRPNCVELALESTSADGLTQDLEWNIFQGNCKHDRQVEIKYVIELREFHYCRRTPRVLRQTYQAGPGLFVEVLI